MIQQHVGFGTLVEAASCGELKEFLVDLKLKRVTMFRLMELMRNYVKLEDSSGAQYRFVALDPNLLDKRESNSVSSPSASRTTQMPQTSRYNKSTLQIMTNTKLGEGSFGTVYLAKLLPEGSKVAVKVIKTSNSTESKSQ